MLVAAEPGLSSAGGQKVRAAQGLGFARGMDRRCACLEGAQCPTGCWVTQVFLFLAGYSPSGSLKNISQCAELLSGFWSLDFMMLG